jgi:hypothetical protein
VNGSAVDAYFTITSTVADQAGNLAAAVSRVQLVDATAPSIGGLSYPPFFTAGGSATFTSTSTDNLDIQLERLNITYGPVQPAVLGGAGVNTLGETLTDGVTAAGWVGFTTEIGGSTLWYPDVAVNGYDATPLITSHAYAFTTNPLTQVQVRATADGTGSGLNGNGNMNTANGIVLNQANTATGSATPIIAGSLPTQTAITATGAAGAGPVKWVICAQAASTACPAVYATPVAFTTAISRDGAAPNTVTINAIATGTSGVFNNPFSQVQFWAYDPSAATEGWRLIGTVTNAATVTDAGGAEPAGRNWQFSFTWDPNSTTAPSTGVTYRVVAIGIGGTSLPAAQQGMALATPIGALSVTVTP